MAKRGSRHRGTSGSRSPFDPGRRRFLAGVAGAAGALALPGCGPAGSDAAEAEARIGAGALPNPEDSGIDHIVQVMMENRSYDHMLGWVPKSNGIQNQVFINNNGEEVPTFHMGNSDPAYGFQGCGWEDPSHGYGAGRIHLNNGAMDGFLKTVDNPVDKFPAGYYNAEDVLFYKGVAENFTICDNYFHGILSSTFPNRMYIHAGATDRNTNTLPWAQQAPSELPTIWDLLAAKGLSGRNYFSDLPLTGLWGTKYAQISKPFEQFLVDAKNGALPAVSYFDPNFGFSVGESPAGVSRDDHPQADIRDGQVYLTEIYNALRASPNWERTLMIVTYDEWGGFFDHVEPTFGPVSAEEGVFNDGRLGFRTPCVILGPRAKRGHVSHFRFDPNSVINLIRWRFGLGSLSARDHWSHNMAMALDFKNPPNLDAPAFGQLSPDGLTSTSRGLPWGAPCFNYLTNQLPVEAPTSVAQREWLEHQNELRPLYEMSKAAGLI